MSIKFNPQNRRCYFSNVSDIEAKKHSQLARGIRTYGRIKFNRHVHL